MAITYITVLQSNSIC